MLFTVLSFDAPPRIDWIEPVSRARGVVLENAYLAAVGGEGRHLILLRGDRLLVTAFDPRHRTPIGTPVPVGLPVHISSSIWGPLLDLSQSGVLAYFVAQPRRDVVLVDRAGREVSLPSPGEVACLSASPDGRFVVGVLAAPGMSASYDLQLLDLTRGDWQPLTRGRSYGAFAWSRDGTLLASRLNRPWNREPGVDRFDLAGERVPVPLPELEDVEFVTAAARDGTLAAMLGAGGVALVASDGTRQELSHEVVGAPDLSPDGGWLVFASQRITGTEQIWLVDRQGRRPRQISSEGGIQPLFSGAGDEIFFRGPDTLMAAWFDPDTGAHGSPEPLFPDVYLRTSFPRDYDVLPDGRFLFSKSLASTTIEIVEGFDSVLEELVAGGSGR